MDTNIVIDKKELVKTLKGQHRKLQSDLLEVVKMTEDNLIEESVNFLTKFRVDLKEHLELENGTFYPDYLKNSNDQDKIKKFINEMVLIGEKVMEFLNKYDKKETISDSKSNFLLELNSIINTLNIRIEIEETGIYNIYAVS